MIFLHFTRIFDQLFLPTTCGLFLGPDVLNFKFAEKVPTYFFKVRFFGNFVLPTWLPTFFWADFRGCLAIGVIFPKDQPFFCPPSPSTSFEQTKYQNWGEGIFIKIRGWAFSETVLLKKQDAFLVDLHDCKTFSLKLRFRLRFGLGLNIQK